MIDLKWPEDESVWSFQDDPADVLQVGDIVYHGIAPIKVMGFCAPSGRNLESMMVRVGYPNEKGQWPETHSTTLDYLNMVRWAIRHGIVKVERKSEFKMHINCDCGTKYTFAGNVFGQYTCPNCGKQNTPATKE